MSKPKPAKHRFLRWLSPLLIIACGLALFGGTLNAPFTSDDHIVVEGIPQLYAFSAIPWAFVSDFDIRNVVDIPGQQSNYGLYRPMLTTSFIINLNLCDHDPFGWRLFNLLLHLIASLLVLVLGNRLLGSRPGGLAAGLLFVCHPTHAEAVASVLGGRSEMLATVFLLAAWWIFLSGDRLSGARRWAVDVGSALVFLLGLWSKENAGVLPGILVLSGYALQNQRLRTLFVRITPHLILMAAYVVFRLSIVGRIAPNEYSSFFGDFSGLRIFITVGAIMATYLRLLLVPYPIYHPDCYRHLPSQTSVLEGILYTLLVAGLIGLAIWRMIRAHREGRPLHWAFAVLFLYGCLVPVSHVIPFRVLMASRFLYLPSVSLCLLVGYLAVKYFASRRNLVLALAGVLFTSYTGLTVWINSVWSDPDLLYQANSECDPDSPDPWSNRGNLRLRQGRASESIPFFEKALELSPGYARPMFNLGLAYQQMGELEKAEKIYRQVLEQDPFHSRALNNLGGMLLKAGRLTEARPLFERVISFDARHPAPFVNLANILEQQGEHGRAEFYLQKALEVAPKVTEAKFNLARLMTKTKRSTEAEKLYREIIADHPGHAMAHNNLGNIFFDRGQKDRAQTLYQKAISLDPRCAPAQFNLGKIDLSAQRYSDALKRFRTALEIRPDWVDAQIGLGYSWLQLGQMDLAREAAGKALSLSPGNPQVQGLLTAIAERAGSLPP